MMVENPDSTFQRLRPTCVKLSKQPTRQCVQELRDSLEFVGNDHLVKLTEYILFPLQLTLQRAGLSNELKQDAVSCIEYVIRKAKLQKLNVFSDLFNVLTVLISDREPGKVANVSEELKLAVINCITCLLETSGLVIRSVLYRSKFLPSLGHAISLLLDVLQHEKSRELKIDALKCLKVISFCDSNEMSNNGLENGTVDVMEEPEKKEMFLNIYESASEAIASFLPGISMALVKVINGDPSQGHVIITMAIDIWGIVVAMVMNDSCLSNDENEDDVMTAISSLARLHTQDKKVNNDKDDNFPEIVQEELKNKTKVLNVSRTTEWFNNTSMKLKVLIEKLTTTASCHSNWKVRLSLVNFCEQILMHCTETLPCCVSLLVDVLVGSLEDEYDQVSLRSKAVLDTLARYRDGNTSFNSILEANLHSQLTSLPRLMRTAGNVNKERALNLLNGYMTLLDDKITSILSSSSHLKRLSLALVQILELDVSDVGIVEERTPERHESAVIPSDTQGKNPISVEIHSVQTSQFPRYRFKHFTGDKIQAAVNHTCQSLGRHGNLSLLLDHFLDLFHESKLNRKQVVYIMNEIIIGFSGKGQLFSENCDADNKQQRLPELLCVVKLLLSSYTCEKVWNLPTSTSQTSSSPGNHMTHPNKPITTYQSLNNNILLTCLLLEGIGIFARSLGQAFNPLLIDTLYLVLAKLGDGNAAVSRSAYGTLVMISQNCGYLSVEDLITSNADYLVNSIALDLKYVFVNEQAPGVLKVMIQYSNQEILTIIEDTIHDIFNVMDLYPDQLLQVLFKVLHALVYSIHQWFTSSQKLQDEQDEQQEEKEEFSQEVTSFIQDYMKSKRIALGEVESEDISDNVAHNSEEVDDGDLYKPDEKPEIPLHIKYATEV